jgi:hypothetical protein
MRTFVAASMALALTASAAAAQLGDNVHGRDPNTFVDNVLSVQVTDTGEGSPALYVTFQDHGIAHAGRDRSCGAQGHGYCISDGAFAAMASVVSTAITSRCKVHAHRQQEPTRRGYEPSWRLNWVQLEAQDCPRH